VQVVNTHLGLLAREQLAQVDAILGPEWLGGRRDLSRTILLGDFNASSGSQPYKRVIETFGDAQVLAPLKPSPTFPAMFPMLRIDHVFVGRAIEVRRAWTSTSALAKTAVGSPAAAGRLRAQVQQGRRPAGRADRGSASGRRHGFQASATGDRDRPRLHRPTTELEQGWACRLERLQPAGGAAVQPLDRRAHARHSRAASAKTGR
jgi:hypothetical protein